MENFEQVEFYHLQKTLETPAHVSCLNFGHAGHLFVGSGECRTGQTCECTNPNTFSPIEDGALRVYDTSSHKVIKAIRGLGAEVSSLVCLKRPGSELRDVWLASGSRVCSILLDSDSTRPLDDIFVDRS
jgi:hypothetical protein